MSVSEVEVEVWEEMDEGLLLLGFWVCFETLVISIIGRFFPRVCFKIGQLGLQSDVWNCEIVGLNRIELGFLWN